MAEVGRNDSKNTNKILNQNIKKYQWKIFRACNSFPQEFLLLGTLALD